MESYYETTLRTVGGALSIRVNTENGSGRIILGFPRDRSDGSVEYNGALDGIESLVLAHACAGLDVESDRYIEGLNTALEAIANNL